MFVELLFNIEKTRVCKIVVQCSDQKCLQNCYSTIHAAPLCFPFLNYFPSGKFAYTIGIHNAVSMATLITTKFPYRFLDDPPFFWRQFFKFSFQPKLAIICSTGKFNYTTPLPFHMTSFLVRGDYYFCLNKMQNSDQFFFSRQRLLLLCFYFKTTYVFSRE